MTKAIAYAYPTSSNAMKAGKAEAYYVQGWHSDGVTRLSPFVDTIKEAEAIADSMPEKWEPAYIRFPLRGSKFYKSLL
jgi:hypothetical protein